jgi:hypothetical protein
MGQRQRFARPTTMEGIMNGKTLSICMVATILCLGCEEEKKVIDVDTLPEGTGTGTAGTGEFTYHEVVTSSSCPEEIGGHAIPGEGDEWDGTLSTEQEEGLFRMMFAGTSGDPGFQIDGGIDGDDSFRVGGTYYYVPTDVTFVQLMDGKFVGGTDEMEGRSKIRVQSNLTPGDATDRIDCELRIDFEATRI